MCFREEENILYSMKNLIYKKYSETLKEKTVELEMGYETNNQIKQRIIHDNFKLVLLADKINNIEDNTFNINIYNNYTKQIEPSYLNEENKKNCFSTELPARVIISVC